MSNNKRVLLLLVLMCSVFVMSHETVEALPFDNEEVNRQLTAGQWYYYSDFYSESDTINVYLETDDTTMLVDFFICDAANYTSWTSLETGTGFGVVFDVHSNYFSFDVPVSGTWYIIVSNRYGSTSLYVDIAIDENDDNRPSYSSSSYDYVNNHEILETTEWWYLTDYLYEDTEISGDFSTYFSTDGIDFFICDEDDYNDWSTGSTIYPYSLIEDYHISPISTFTIPYSDTWYIVFSAIGQADAITLSYGIDIDTSAVSTTTTTTTADDGTVGPLDVIDAAITGIVSIIVVLAVVSFCCCKKKKDGRQPGTGFPPPGGFGDARSGDNVVLGALKSYPRIGMNELADILKMPVDTVRRTTLKLIGTGAISGTFDKRSDEFTSADATAVGRDMREDALDAFALPRCPNCSAPLTKPLVAGETMECPSCGTWVTG